jgi:hypothetical protein
MRYIRIGPADEASVDILQEYFCGDFRRQSEDWIDDGLEGCDYGFLLRCQERKLSPEVSYFCINLGEAKA